MICFPLSTDTLQPPTHHTEKCSWSVTKVCSVLFMYIFLSISKIIYLIPQPLQLRHNEHDDVWNHQRFHCSLNRLFRQRWKKTSKLHVTVLCAWNSPVTGEFSAQMGSNAKMFPFDDIIMQVVKRHVSPTNRQCVFYTVWLRIYWIKFIAWKYFDADFDLACERNLSLLMDMPIFIFKTFHNNNDLIINYMVTNSALKSIQL